MGNASYRVFGVGLGENDLRYVGWTQGALEEQTKRIAPLLGRSGRLSIFEIESTESAEDARRTVSFLCRYFQSLGLNVIRGD